MKRLKLQLHQLSIVQISVFLLVIGLFLGILCANIFKDNYQQKMLDFKENVFTEISANDIDYAGLFRYVLSNNFGDFFVFWLLSITILGVPYMAFKITSFGFFSGFFISAVTMQFGAKGILLILVYIFPHGLLYLPIALICLYKGYELCRSIYHENHTRISEVSRLIKSKIAIILILAAALLVGSFLEAYAGAFILKKTMGLFI